jgi:predicted transcriptional regulator
MDFTIIERAGLKALDFAQIVGVTRARVSQWKTTPPSPKYARYQVVVDTLARLERAVESNKLPLRNMTKEVRSRVIEKLKVKTNTN